MTLLGLDPVEFAPVVESGGAAAAGVRHALTTHPLLSLDALADLAEELQRFAVVHGRLREDWPVEHHLSKQPRVLASGKPKQAAGMSAPEMIRGVESNDCWIVLWNVENSPRYARLLDECLNEIEPLATPRDATVFREGFVFISAPHTVTPVHIDPEHNVLLQVTAEKTVAVGRAPSEEAWHREIERVLGGGDRHLPFASVEEREFLLTPGRGVYIPPFAPHWVRNGPRACVSLSVTWRTKQYFRTEYVHRVNRRLRRLGLSPLPPGQSQLRDTLKVRSMAAVIDGRRAMRRVLRASSSETRPEERAVTPR
jgi:hypothetical protein